MNATELNAALQYIDDQYLDIADASPKEIIQMSKRNVKITTRILLIAAVVALLTITAYAADFMNVKSLVSHGGKSYSAYQELQDAMVSAGYKIDAKESFDTGFQFRLVRTRDVIGQDDAGSQVMTYQSISVLYQKDECNVMLNATPDFAEIPESESVATDSREIDGIEVRYKVDHYKFVPDDYELTDADKVWMEQPGNYLTYGSDEVEERDVAFLGWIKNGIRYNFMDSGAKVKPDTLFAMAEELILMK